MFKDNSLLRLAEHKFLSLITLNGRVLDLGGDKNAEYQKLLKGNFEIFNVNFSQKAEPDLLHDLEVTPLPLASESFDAVLLINVIEHIFNYQALLSEANRLLKKDGKLVIAIPFMFPVHPSPRDFNRFTGDALKLILEKYDFKNTEIHPLGGGVFTTRTLFLHRLLPQPFRWFYGLVAFPVARVNDYLFTKVANLLGKSYKYSDYALGYCVVAQK